MTKEFDLIIFPYKFRHQKLIKRENSYETKFTNTINSKKISARRIKKHSTFLHLIIDDSNNICMNGISKAIFEFNTPVDFMLPVSDETKEEYEKLHSVLTNDNLEEIYRYSKLFRHKYKKGFPFYPVPKITQSAFSSTKNLKDSDRLLRKNLDYKNTVLVKYDDEIPNDCPIDDQKEETNKIALNFVESLFEKHKGMKMKYLVEKLADFEIETGISIGIPQLKSCVRKVAYFMTNGPWGKTWIKYGVDPKIDRQMVLCQIIYTSGRGNSIQIFEYPHLIEILEKEKKLCFRDECDFRFGYLTEYGHAKCKLELQELEFADNEEDFDVFD